MPSYIAKPPSPVLNPSHPLNRGLVGAWLMTEGAGGVVRDMAGTSKAAIDVANWTGSQRGRALDGTGSGSDAVAIAPHSPRFDATDALTLSAWIKPSSVTDRQSIISKYQTDDDERTWNLELNDGSVWLFVGQSGGSDFVFAESESGFVTDNEWQHVAAVVRIGDPLLIYHNAIEPAYVDQDTVIDPIPTNALDVLIGNTHHDDRAYVGHIDDVRIWDRALTPSEIRHLYAARYDEFRRRTMVAVWGAAALADAPPDPDPGLSTFARVDGAWVPTQRKVRIDGQWQDVTTQAVGGGS